MSMRRTVPPTSVDHTQSLAYTATAAVPPALQAQRAFDALSPTEQAAGSLGVNPEEFKPIAFMNDSHFATLIKNNSLGDNLARRLEAYRSLAAADDCARQ